MIAALVRIANEPKAKHTLQDQTKLTTHKATVWVLRWFFLGFSLVLRPALVMPALIRPVAPIERGGIKGGSMSIPMCGRRSQGSTGAYGRFKVAVRAIAAQGTGSCASCSPCINARPFLRPACAGPLWQPV